MRDFALTALGIAIGLGYGLIVHWLNDAGRLLKCCEDYERGMSDAESE